MYTAMNTRPKVLCMVDLSRVPEALEILQKAPIELDYRPPNRQELMNNIGEFDALWSHVDLKLDKQVLDRASNLKVINTSSTGTDHIDKEEAARHGIRILSITRDYGLLRTFTATAECAWMLILACCRNFRTAAKNALDGNWKSEHLYRVGMQLYERTLGVLGVGRLGSMTVEFGKGFRMRVLGCDLKPFSIPGVEAVDFETLLRESDVISIHIHMTPENYHLFDEKTFASMKDGAILVNTSRGDIIDEEALLHALDAGKLKAFGADVLHDEWRADMKESPVIQYARTHENVVITPHVGGGTVRSLVDARIFSAKKLIHYLLEDEELTMP